MKKDSSDSFDRDCDSALGWIARLRSDIASDEDRQAFALWLAEDPGHRQAMDQMLDLWDDLGVVRHMPNLDTVAQDFTTAANSPRYWPWAAALTATLVLGVLLLWPTQQGGGGGELFETALGEQRSVELSDQSRVTLNTATRLRVSLEDDQRLITLLRGEAFFQVQPDPQRPFHVDTGSTRITVLGTAFNVYRERDATDITVTEGVVRVTELGDTGGRAPATEVLHLNQQLHADRRGLHAIATVDTGKHTAWQRGELVAEQMPLPELVKQLQRYHPTRIFIVDPDVAALTVSGVFRLDNLEAILQALEVSLDLKATPLDDDSVQLLKAEG